MYVCVKGSSIIQQYFGEYLILPGLMESKFEMLDDQIYMHLKMALIIVWQARINYMNTHVTRNNYLL